MAHIHRDHIDEFSLVVRYQIPIFQSAGDMGHWPLYGCTFFPDLSADKGINTLRPLDRVRA